MLSTLPQRALFISMLALQCLSFPWFLSSTLQHFAQLCSFFLAVAVPFTFRGGGNFSLLLSKSRQVSPSLNTNTDFSLNTNNVKQPIPTQSHGWKYLGWNPEPLSHCQPAL